MAPNVCLSLWSVLPGHNLPGNIIVEKRYVIFRSPPTWTSQPLMEKFSFAPIWPETHPHGRKAIRSNKDLPWPNNVILFLPAINFTVTPIDSGNCTGVSLQMRILGTFSMCSMTTGIALRTSRGLYLWTRVHAGSDSARLDVQKALEGADADTTNLTSCASLVESIQLGANNGHQLVPRLLLLVRALTLMQKKSSQMRHSSSNVTKMVIGLDFSTAAEIDDAADFWKETDVMTG